MPPAAPSHAVSPQGSRPAHGWLADGHRITDGRPSVVAMIDLDRPGDGIAVRAAAAADAHRLLGLDLRAAAHLADHWVRGGDVTAVYESNDARRLRATAMWRQHPATPPVRAWELVVSAQTSLLESDPLLAVVADAAAEDLRWGTVRGPAIHWHDAVTEEATCLLLSPARPAAGASMLLAAHPTDAGRFDVARREGRMHVACWLFPTTLEKGVLLRSRVLAAVGPATAATDWASPLTAAFAASPPMLTT